MRCHAVRLSFCAATLGVFLAAGDASAAEFTDLMDAADDFDDYDEDTYDPFDFSIEPAFKLELGSAKITREAPCIPDESAEYGWDQPAVQNNPRLVVDPSRCSEPTTVYNKELLYDYSQSSIEIELRAGLYKDLEFHLTVPYVFDQTHGMEYADEDVTRRGGKVDETNSSVDPSDARVASQAERVFQRDDGSLYDYEAAVRQLDLYNAYRYFDVPKEYSRSGFADPSIGLWWGPFNSERDDTKATLILGMDYVMPIAPVKEADPNDTDVGEGKHVLKWTLASSKRFDWIEPYFGLQYELPFAASDSPIDEVDGNNEGQVFTQPPQHGEITVGTEFIPYENTETGERYGIDLRFTFGYTSEGRDYTPLYDFLTNSECNGATVNDVLPYQGNPNASPDAACAWIVQRPANAEPTPVYDLAQLGPEARGETQFYTDGIMTVESYGTFGGRLGFYLQPSEYFQLKAIVGLKHQQEHFITNARTGEDVDPEPFAENLPADENDVVDLTGEAASVERNPVFNPTYDSAGQRFRIEEFNTWEFIVNAALQF